MPKMKTSKRGIMLNNTAAFICPYSLKRSLENLLIPKVTVFIFSVETISIGQKNSFHDQVHFITMQVTIGPLNRGMITLKNTHKSDAPSILPASIYELGIVSIDSFNRKVPNADIQPGIIIPKYVFVSPILLTTMYSGIEIISIGIMIKPKNI